MTRTGVPRYIPWLGSIDRFASDPVGTQSRLLRRLLATAADTEWGRRFDFASIAQADDVVRVYRENVPLHTYDDYRDDVARIRAGEPDVSWPGQFRHFAVSSGTASAGKIIPVSTEMLNLNRSFSLTTAFSYLRESGNPEFVFGRLLTVPGRVDEDPDRPGTWVGEASGLMYLVAPWFVRTFMQAVDRDVLFMPRWEDKLKTIVERTRTMDVRAIAMVPSWAVVLFEMLIARHNEATGSNATCVRDVWPNLQVFFSGAVPLSSYEALLREQIGGKRMDFVESYGASEGVFSFQSSPTDSDMLLHLDNGVYFDFVRLDDHADPPTRFGIGEVETDVRYSIHVSTASGLWGYRVGDVVRFTSTDPNRIVVAGRTSEMLDAYGEAVFGEEARGALEFACHETGARVRDYHIAPMPPGRSQAPRHQWLVEFDGAAPDGPQFAQLIDDRLQTMNRHYVTRRECGAFGTPEIVPLPPGTFARYLRENRKSVSMQTKVPRMDEDRSMAEQVLKTAETIDDPMP